MLHRPRTVPEELADRAAPPVMVFDTEGNFIQGWGGEGDGYEWPGTEHGIFVDHNGFVWIAGSGPGDDQLLGFTSEGEFVMQLGRANRSIGNTDTPNVNRVAGVYVYPPTNELFVADGCGNRRVIIFDAETEAFRRMWGAFGDSPTDPVEGEAVDESNPEHFDLVHGMRVSNDGRVYVSDRARDAPAGLLHRGGVHHTAHDGSNGAGPGGGRGARGRDGARRPVAELIENVATAHRLVSPTAFSPDAEQSYLFVAERSNQQVVVLDRETLRAITRFGRVGGEFYILHNMVSDPDGNLYTAEVSVGARAQKFANTGMAPADSM